jgi:predicted ATPase/class 3 adenylate cyclase
VRRADLPTGTVTFLFTDVEGSTQVLHELGAEAYASALAEHRRVVRDACTRHGGVEVDTQGDAFFLAFATAPGAVAAADEITGVLATGPIHLRMGLHTGTPLVTEEGYVGPDVHRAARIAAAGHGGQVLVSASTAALVDGGVLRDLGEHRFKDLAAAERVFQLGEAGFPPLRSLYRTNLPVPATAFLGREQELAEVVELLTRDDVRLLTLTGAGGTGKTRLAVQAAAETAERFPDGLWWVPLASLRDPMHMLPAVAKALDVSEDADRAVLEALLARLDGASALLLLDNLEQLLPVAAHDVAQLVGASPTVAVLVTSRESLRLAAEHEFRVGSLAGTEAVSFFTQRAAAHGVVVEPSDGVRELCRRLDDLPLALELAAGRLKLFTPEQLVERLGQRLDLLEGGRDADPRQQTLRATIQWSYELLDEGEQLLFRRLSVFARGCAYELAERVCDADANGLRLLIERNLLRRRDEDSGPRYWMLETIRQFARECLDRSGESDVILERHARVYLQLAEASRRMLRDAHQVEWLRRLSAEEDDLRAALDWSITSRHAELALRLVYALEVFWIRAVRRTEATRWLERALAVERSVPPPLRARALATGAIFAPSPEVAWQRINESIPVLRSSRDDEGLAFALRALAWLHRERGELQSARAALEEAVELFALLGHTVTTRLLDLGAIAIEEGDPERGKYWLERGLAAAAEEGDLLGASAAHEALGELALDRQDLAEAERQFVRSIELGRQLQSGTPDFSAVESIVGLAAVAVRRGKARLAGLLWETASRLGEAGDEAVWKIIAGRLSVAVHLLTAEDVVAYEDGRRDAQDIALESALDTVLELATSDESVLGSVGDNHVEPS